MRIKKKKSEKKLKKDFTKEKYDDILYEHSARVTRRTLKTKQKHVKRKKFQDNETNKNN